MKAYEVIAKTPDVVRHFRKIDLQSDIQQGIQETLDQHIWGIGSDF